MNLNMTPNPIFRCTVNRALASKKQFKISISPGPYKIELPVGIALGYGDSTVYSLKHSDSI